MSDTECAYEGCRLDTEPPYDERLWIYIHPECDAAWWEETGPYPKPIVIACRNGPDVVVGATRTDEVWDSEDDPDHLRSRGVLT